ncbi:MAG: Oligoendopeptidase F, plasmid [Alphaproteobacteria bacterium MarineAlpha5_Bin8]|nr:MAG: Oligoendopeptidase F, plasmid [Alphaproteobacteria bacterium MarineAlpha5_Bin7]PPR48112.1 MAG: Oligoendopeptidase F, plasmid [Alphaproteobacteria bacterium MarineAlpha5_Bin8]PPR54310.1 MAG: Oligoendopeptidase F, plasmid [Alphaproteobacteria bacterium MarineAlpha5_Bin6]|tara:strand:+ start:6354 stop:8156 length:1803 start_codon:yes stop_codon:yes gene_type:complete
MNQKNKQLYHSKNYENLPVWNLKDLYKSPNSKEIQKDLIYLRKKSQSFESKYFKNVSKLSAVKLYNAINELEKIDLLMDKIISYAHLLVSENIKHEKNNIFYQQIKEKITSYSSSIIFFTLELNQISEKNIKKLLKNKSLQNYKNWIINKRSFKTYQLDLKTEKLLQEKSITSYSAWVRLFDDTIASLNFPYKNKKLTSAEIFNLFSDKKGQVRKIAAKSVGEVLGRNIKIFTTITNTLAKDKSINDSWRKLPRPVSSRNLSNVVEDEVVDSLVSSVISSYPRLSHRYYSLKAKWFGKKQLMYWDRNAPLPFQNNREYLWKDAKEIILNAYFEFNSNIGEIVKKFFDESWIHSPVLEGKSPGAFAASTVASAHPFILVNYQGKARDVATLAHELGHGVHQYLAGRKQSHFNTSTPLTLAETASVFGEMLTFKNILKQVKTKKEKKALLANKVEDMLNTVVRQIAFYEFEKNIHDKRKKTELSVQQVCEIWIDVQKRSLGPSIKFEEEYKYYWSYIPHFIHSPFYVYAYAFGDCLVNSLYKIYENGFDNFQEKYITLLESGGSKKYNELLKPFKLDPSKKNFWNKGLNLIEELIDQLEELQ